MKQRLFLLMYMLATAFCAKAYTVTFDVKFASFMTDRQYFNVEFDGNRVYEYDESTGKYTVPDVSAGRHRYSAEYSDFYSYDFWGMIPLYDYDLIIESDTVISLDFTDYHTVTFKAPDGYTTYTSTTVYYGDNYENSRSSSSDRLYLPNGSYKCAVSLRSTETGYLYGYTDKQIFTMEGADKDILIDINPNDFHKVDFSLVDRNGAVEDETILEDENGNSFNFYFNGHKTMMLKNGDYFWKHITSTYYPELNKQFTVAGKDMEVSAPYESYKKLTVNVNLSQSDCSLRLEDETSTYNTYLQVVSDTECKGEYYFAPGVYEYILSSGSRYKGTARLKTGKIELNQDMILPIDVSDCRLITFVPVDKDRNPIPFNKCSNFAITTESGYQYKVGYLGENDNSLYIQPGNHTVSLCYDRHTYYYQDFTVDNEDRQIEVVCDESQYKEVTVNFLNVPKEWGSFYSAEIQVFSGDRIYAENTSLSTGSKIFLPDGNYEYRVERGGMVPLTGTATISGYSPHIDVDFSRYGMATVELKDAEGTPVETTSSNECRFSLTKDGKMTTLLQGFQVREVRLLAPAGTYLFSAYIYGCGFAEKTVNITAGARNKETMTFTSQPNKYLVDLFTNIANCTVTLSDYGSIITTDDHEACFYNVDAASRLIYTASAPGYKTVKGTVKSGALWGYNGIITKSITMEVDKGPMAIETVQANGSFRVYPTIADDYINIRINNQDETAWTIRLISATGSVVYMNKEQLDGEKQIYVGNLPEGFYLLTLNNGEQQMTYKILKK